MTSMTRHRALTPPRHWLLMRASSCRRAVRFAIFAPPAARCAPAIASASAQDESRPPDLLPGLPGDCLPVAQLAALTPRGDEGPSPPSDDSVAAMAVERSRCSLRRYSLARAVRPQAPPEWAGRLEGPEQDLLRGAGWILLGLSLGWIMLAQAQMGGAWRIGVDEAARTALIAGGLFGNLPKSSFPGSAGGACGTGPGLAHGGGVYGAPAGAGPYRGPGPARGNLPRAGPWAGLQGLLRQGGALALARRPF